VVGFRQCRPQFARRTTAIQRRRARLPIDRLNDDPDQSLMAGSCPPIADVSCKRVGPQIEAFMLIFHRVRRFQRTTCAAIKLLGTVNIVLGGGGCKSLGRFALGPTVPSNFHIHKIQV